MAQATANISQAVTDQDLNKAGPSGVTTRLQTSLKQLARNATDSLLQSKDTSLRAPPVNLPLIQPAILICATCDIQYDTAWELLVHCTENHSMNIYKEAIPQISLTDNTTHGVPDLTNDLHRPSGITAGQPMAHDVQAQARAIGYANIELRLAKSEGMLKSVKSIINDLEKEMGEIREDCVVLH